MQTKIHHTFLTVVDSNIIIIRKQSNTEHNDFTELKNKDLGKDFATFAL